MTDFDEARIAHLTMIQGVVTRMAGNSFALKALTVTLTAAVLVFAGATKEPSPVLVFAGLVPVVVFWLLDAHHLRLERLFRRLYDGVRGGEVADPFDMDIAPYRVDEQGVLRIAVSWSVVSFYGALFVVLIVLTLLLSR